LGIPDDAVLFGVFGGLTPEKRIPQILEAMRRIAPHAPSARLLLAGAAAPHYDVHAGIAANGLQDRVTVTGYLDEDDLTAYLAACDVSVNLRWPTARETSGAWLRALAAGLPAISTDLAHLEDVPSLDPRTWTARAFQPSTSNFQPPVCVAVDILDEDHSLRLAMRRLAQDAELRERLGRAAQAWWQREHALEVMVEDYVRAIAEAAARPAPQVTLPPHMRSDGDSRLRSLLAPFGVEAPI
jgi:glycosyltransferase involved in cell wall biosynthesis